MSKETTSAAAALLTLDSEGGWDHDPGWGDRIQKSIRMAITFGLVEHGVSFDICHWRLTDEGIEMRRKMDVLAAKVPSSGDPEKDAGWLVSTPWLGRRMAVFGLTREDALAQAERGRAAHVAELQALVDRWSGYELEARFVEAERGE
jgi:hypothetical protein